MEKILSVSLSDAERWEWYAAGDKTVAPRAVSRHVTANEPEVVLWEMGLVFAVPLVVAVACWLTLS